MNILQITDVIMNALTAGEGSRNSRVPQAQVRAEVQSTRGRMIDELLEGGRPLSPDFYIQHLELPTQEAPALEVLGREFGGESYILFARIPEPHLHPLRLKPLVSYVGDSDGSSEPYRIVYGNHYLHMDEDELIGHAPTAIINGNLLIIAHDAPRRIRIKMVPKDPDEVLAMGLGATDCSYREEGEYPAPLKLQDLITGKLIESYSRQFYRMNPHQRNNFKDTQGLEP